jgi:hypothetical protein
MAFGLAPGNAPPPPPAIPARFLSAEASPACELPLRVNMCVFACMHVMTEYLAYYLLRYRPPGPIHFSSFLL